MKNTQDGIASPNPNYEQPVKSVTGENIVRVKSAQLIDFASKVATGYSFENDMLVYESSQKAYAGIGFDITDLIKNNPNKKIYFVYKDIDVSNQSGNVVQLGIKYNDQSPNYYAILLNHNLENSAYTIPNDTRNISAVTFAIFSNNTGNSTDNFSVTIIKPQLLFDEPQEKELDLESYNKFDKNNANIINAYINSVNKVIESNDNARTIIFPCKPNTTYTTSKIASQRFIIGTAENYTIGTICSTMSADFTATKKTVTTTQNDHYLIIYFYLSTVDTLTEQEILNSIQIVEGSTEKPYQEYYHYEVYENGYFSKENGKWYLNNEWGKYIFNNDLTQNGIDTNSVKLLTPALNIEANLTPIQLGNYTYSNLFSKSIAMENYTGLNGTTSSKKIRISLGLEYATTYAEAYQKLANLIIVYPLETPSKTEITNQTLINQLNDIYKLMSYDGTTIIETECEEGNLPILIKARALKGE